MASLVPEPMEKCAVWAASPIRMRLPLCQVSQTMRGKLSQAEPRRCLALVSSVAPSRYLAKSFSAARQVSSWLIASKPKLAPGGFAAFDDEGRGVVVELVGVGPDPAVFGLLEREGEGFERFVGAEPDVLVRADVDVDAEVLGVGACAALSWRRRRRGRDRRRRRVRARDRSRS